MGYLADVYVIKKTRSKDLADDFLNHFLPDREETADEYFIPQYSYNPIQEFDNANDLMLYLELNKNYSNGIYWRNTDEESLNKHGMIFYNEDGTMIFGISRNADMSGNLNTDNENECLTEMKKYLDTSLGYIRYETPPTNSYSYIEFVKIVEELEKQPNLPIL